MTVDELTTGLEESRRMAMGVALRVVKNSSDAEDVVQIASMRAWQKLALFRGDCKFSTWYIRIVFHSALQHRRKTSSKGRKKAFDEYKHDRYLHAIPLYVEKLYTQEKSREFLKKIRRLPSCQRRALLLRITDKDTTEIAKIMGVSLSAAKSYVSRGRKELRGWVS